MSEKKRAYERFLEYSVYPTMSDPETGTTPSTEKQLVLAKVLCKELIDLGLEDASVDEFGYVYATLPANAEGDFNTIGFISHMDTSPDAPDQNIRPEVVDYKGGDIVLNKEKEIVLKTADYPYLEEYKGTHLIVSDGTTLIGADDKAGISEIITALETLIKDNIPHGKICVAFTPDEEIGEGADHFNVEKFGADYAYTVDGGAIGELEYENFNAASAKIIFHGRSIHPGSAKDKMINAARIAAEFDSLLREDEIPEKTDGYEGFHHLIGIKGECELATSEYIIRDHSKDKFEDKKREFENAAQQINDRYGNGVAELILNDSYYNMKEKIEENLFIVERAKNAMKACGVNPVTIPIRGGTDGARLSFMGLPCPNLCTGGENFHSRFEFVCVEAMEKIAQIITKIATDVTVEKKEDVHI